MTIPPDTPAADPLALAVGHLDAGRLAEAEAIIRAILRQTPAHPHALTLLGVVACRAGQPQAGADLFRQALAAGGDLAEGHANLATALTMLGRDDAADADWRQALAHRPDDTRLLNHVAHRFLSRGLTDEALPLLQRAIALDPAHPEAHATLGSAFKALGRLDEAAAALDLARTLAPEEPGFVYNLGNVLLGARRFEEAEARFRQVLAAGRDSADLRLNLALALHEQARLDDAIVELRQALAQAPDHPKARHWLGYLLRLNGDITEGGDVTEGPRRFEDRLNAVLFRDQPESWWHAPVWDGRPLPDGTLLLVIEGGVGDALQFIRYVPLAAQRCARVIVHGKPDLQPLLATVTDDPRVLFNPTPPPLPTARALLMSLPYRLGMPPPIPGSVPYLSADPARVAAWRPRLAALPGLRVGLAWESRGDRTRSIPVARLKELAAVPGVSLVTLQKGAGWAEFLALPPSERPTLQALPFDDDGSSFADTAAMMAHLDLVITIDTALAHLAGALGRPAWVMLPLVPDWRWLTGREDSPWYPSLRLFRAHRRDDWTGVVRRVADELAALAAAPLRP